jgi:tRNA(Ile)-lysidine synthase
MDIMFPKSGKYVVAVSGGVDSMALLDLLHSKGDYKLIVAHLDHGIREESAEDRRHVMAAASERGLPFVYHEVRLGPGASEAKARKARYEFLEQARSAAGARGIITAHHQDDVLETVILNLLRGTGRRGMSSLASRHTVIRPLLHVPKSDLIGHAKDRGITWREDSTNSDETYQRNYVRHRLLPKLNPEERAGLLKLVEQMHGINHELDHLLANQLHLQTEARQLDRTWFSHLPHPLAREVMAAWLRAHGIAGFDRPALERLVVAGKTLRKGRETNVSQGVRMVVTSERLALERHER